MKPNLHEIEAASRIVYECMSPTPQLCWPLLSGRLGTEVWVKHENHTPIGAFKIRGAGIHHVPHAADQRDSGPGRRSGGWSRLRRLYRSLTVKPCVAGFPVCSSTDTTRRTLRTLPKVGVLVERDPDSGDKSACEDADVREDDPNSDPPGHLGAPISLRTSWITQAVQCWIPSQVVSLEPATLIERMS